eukprot:2708237-Rhodomonas_salina.3
MERTEGRELGWWQCCCGSSVRAQRKCRQTSRTPPPSPHASFSRVLFVAPCFKRSALTSDGGLLGGCPRSQQSMRCFLRRYIPNTPTPFLPSPDAQSLRNPFSWRKKNFKKYPESVNIGCRSVGLLAGTLLQPLFAQRLLIRRSPDVPAFVVTCRPVRPTGQSATCSSVSAQAASDVPRCVCGL